MSRFHLHLQFSHSTWIQLKTSFCTNLQKCLPGRLLESPAHENSPSVCPLPRNTGFLSASLSPLARWGSSPIPAWATHLRLWGQAQGAHTPAEPTFPPLVTNSTLLLEVAHHRVGAELKHLFEVWWTLLTLTHRLVCFQAKESMR